MELFTKRFKNNKYEMRAHLYLVRCDFEKIVLLNKSFIMCKVGNAVTNMPLREHQRRNIVLFYLRVQYTRSHESNLQRN